MDAVDGEDAEHQVVQRQDHRFGSIHGAALILLGAAVALAPRVPERWFLPLYAVAAAAWLALRHRSLPLAPVIAIALILRVFLLTPEPRLSGDVYRYLSDGRMLAGGTNPYAYTPTDPRINHPEIRSIYPPHAQLLFALWSAVAGPPLYKNGGSAAALLNELWSWRLLIIAFDLVAIVLLRRHALAYATCPLVLFEGTWSGHLDLVAGVFLLIALLKRSGTAAGIAAGLKIIPIAAVPALFRRRVPLSFVLAFLLPFVPFLGGPIMPGLRDYATRWIFNSPLYELVFFLVEKIPTKTIWTHHPLRFELISDVVYRHVYPDFVTRVVMACIAAGAILLARRVSTAVAALLLCSPAIHPWYWLTLLASSLVERTRWTLVALAAPASYLLYGGTPAWLVFVLCYAVALTPLRPSARGS